MNKFLITIALFLSALSLRAQDKVEIAAAYDDEENAILLRWAPNNSILWLKSLKHGYRLEKFVYQRDGKLLPTPLDKKVVFEAVKPEPLDNWEELVNANDYAAIAAQSMFGDYVAFNDQQTDVFSIVNKAKEQDSRFSMALFAADQSIEVAEKSGLFYKDYEVNENERYLYTIVPNYQDSTMKLDTGSVFFGPLDKGPNPRPQMSHSIQENGLTQVLWFKSSLLEVYSSFIVEKADESLEFEAMNELPIINLDEGPTISNQYASYVDTARSEGTVFYRVKGKDIFGRISAPSDTLKVEILPVYESPFASIDSLFIGDNKSVNARIKYKGDMQYIDNVFLERSQKADGNYELVDKGKGNKEVLIDKSPITNNYYRVGVSFFDKIQYSLPILYNVIDSVPPSQPIIDGFEISDSLIILKWNKLPESDVAGFRLYKSMFNGIEPSLVKEIKTNDTSVVVIENLKFINNERIFYLSAVDEVGNTSELSEPFKVKLPDIVPPATPIISSVIKEGDSYKMSWLKSSSIDIDKYLIYQKNVQNYKLVGVVDTNSLFFKKQLPQNINKISLRLVAVDSSGNEAVSKPFQFSFNDEKNDLNVIYNVTIDDKGLTTIFWETKYSDHYSTSNIYVKSNEQWNLLKTVPYENGKIEIIDSNVKSKANVKLVFL